MHRNWRDCQAWRDEGIRFNTTNNEACKLYDAALTQYVSWCEDEDLNGLYGTIQSMMNADPGFLMGHVFNTAYKLFGGPDNTDAYQHSLESLNELRRQQRSILTERELMHVDAINIMACGDLGKACSYWERILLDNPNDMLALKLAFDSYFHLGAYEQMRDTLAHVLPLWKPSQPLYSYLYGMLGFGFSQTNLFDKAEKYARKGLELNRNDAWSTHVICHVNEYRNSVDDGLKFLEQTEQDWSMCNLLAKHNYWHWCLYHIEKGDNDSAIRIFDEKIYPSSVKLHSYVDACSVLYRLKLEGCTEIDPSVDKLNRWKNLEVECLPLMNAKRLTFNEVHYFMSISACHDEEEKLNFYTLLNNHLHTDHELDFVEVENMNNLGDDVRNVAKKTKKSLGVPIYKAIDSFERGDYAKVVELLYPIRHDIVHIGGSNAQRDIFNLLLTQAALRSDLDIHKKIGLALTNEKRIIKPGSQVTERIFNSFGNS